jgi:dethiobiotin synthase
MRHHFFITGTDAGVGKTVLSALLCAALDAVYWKPIQTGTLEGSDRVTVMRLAGIGTDRTLDEVYKFVPPVSPDLAARWAGVEIDLGRVNMPSSLVNDWLIVEGAGGVLVPINQKQFVLDMMVKFKLPVIVAARSAMGTVNHTLLTLAALHAAELPAEPGEPGNHRAVRPRPGDWRNSQASQSSPHGAHAGLHESFRSRRICAVVTSGSFGSGKSQCHNLTIFWTFTGGVAFGHWFERMEAESGGVCQRAGGAGIAPDFVSRFFGADVSDYQ